MQRQLNETAQPRVGKPRLTSRWRRTDFRFERLMINRQAGLFHNIRYFPQVMKLYIKYLRHLEDDFSMFSARESFAVRNVSETLEWRLRQRSHGLAHERVPSRWRRTAFNERSLEGMVEFIERVTPHFYLVLADNEVCGFFCLEHLIGSAKQIHSAEVVTCFNKKYWGTFTKYAARAFQDFCFEELGLKKLKALVYPQNSRVKAILRVCGFKLEACLRAETRKNGRFQDIEIYSVFNNKEDLCN